MLTVIEKVIFLQNVEVFTDVPTEDLAYLAAIAEEVNYKSGEDIYKKDEPSDALYLVLEGKVRLHRDGSEITIANPKDAFGTGPCSMKPPGGDRHPAGGLPSAAHRPGRFFRSAGRSHSDYPGGFQNRRSPAALPDAKIQRRPRRH